MTYRAETQIGGAAGQQAGEWWETLMEEFGRMRWKRRSRNLRRSNIYLGDPIRTPKTRCVFMKEKNDAPVFCS